MRDPEKRARYDLRRAGGRGDYDAAYNTGSTRSSRSSTSSRGHPSETGGDTGRVVRDLQSCLDAIATFEHFSVIHVFHGGKRLNSGSWMTELEQSGFFQVLHVNLFQTQKELLEYFGVEQYPSLVLAHGNKRSAPFRPSDEAVRYGVVGEEVKREALDLLGRKLYEQTTNFGVLNKRPELLELSPPDGSGCVRVVYFDSSGALSFEFFMLALSGKKLYPHVCFFHVVHSSAFRAAGVAWVLDPDSEIAGRRGVGVDTLFSVFNVRAGGGNKLFLYHPLEEAYQGVGSFSNLQQLLSKHAYQERSFLREATAASVSNGKFIVLVGAASGGEGKGGVYPSKEIFSAYNKFCENVDQSGQLACFWMRGNVVTSSSEVGGDWPLFVKEAAEKVLSLRGESGAAASENCATLLLFDGPERFVSILSDSRAADLVHAHCFRADKNSFGAAKEWWLRKRVAKAVDGDLVAPAFPPPSFSVGSVPPTGILAALEKFVRGINSFVETFWQDPQQRQALLISLAVLIWCLVGVISYLALRQFLNGGPSETSSSEHENVRLCFRVTVPRLSVETKWGLSPTPGHDILTVSTMMEGGLMNSFNTVHLEQLAPFLIQPGDVIFAVNDARTTGPMIHELKTALTCTFGVTRPTPSTTKASSSPSRAERDPTMPFTQIDGVIYVQEKSIEKLKLGPTPDKHDLHREVLEDLAPYFQKGDRVLGRKMLETKNTQTPTMVVPFVRWRSLRGCERNTLSLVLRRTSTQESFGLDVGAGGIQDGSRGL